jgi:alpha-L-fucosidase
MRIGFYYSSLLDWTFTKEPIKDFADLSLVYPKGEEYLAYVRDHWLELIDSYEPSLLWSDIGYPPGYNINELFAYFYNKFPDGVVNDRWSQVPAYLRRWMGNRPGRWLTDCVGTRMFLKGKTGLSTGHCDYITPEYTTLSQISSTKWECVRGMGLSFGYNRQEKPEDFISFPELVRLLVDIVSKNGNLLLNVGPKPGGEIPDVQRNLLKGLGAWLAVNGEAIYGTRPWKRADGATLEGPEIRFTGKEGSLFAILMDTPPGETVTIKSLEAASGSVVKLLGWDGELIWRQAGSDLLIVLPGPLPDIPAHAFKIIPSPI